MIPNFNTWLRGNAPYPLGTKVRISMAAKRWPTCYGIVRQIDANMIGLQIPVLEKPETITWYPLNQLSRYPY